jgi:CubicO group peptidase (beta-lactamase class C family)
VDGAGLNSDRLEPQRLAIESAGATSYAVCRTDPDAEQCISGGGIGADTLVEAGSITKVITGLLLAVAVEQREVSLADSLSRFLSGAGRVGGVTLEALATHRSGLPRLSLGLLVRALTHPSDPYAGVTTKRLVTYAGHSRLRPQGPPRYSNIGVALLGHALSAAAKADYWELAHERVLAPLGMHHSGNLPDSKTWTAGRLWHTDAVSPAGGLRGPVTDLLRLATWAKAPKDTPLGPAFDQATSPRCRFGTDHIGLCWMTRETANGPVLWHNGGTGSAYAFLGASRSTAVAAVVGTRPAAAYDETLWEAFELPAGDQR